MNTCGTCQHWDLSGTVAKYGFGHCKAHPDPIWRAGWSTGPQTLCKIGKFEKAPVKVIARREKEQGALL